jgi:hypothetical protein
VAPPWAASRAPRPARSRGRTGRRTSALRINRTSVQIKNTYKTQMQNDEVNGVRDGSAGLLTVFPEARERITGLAKRQGERRRARGFLSGGVTPRRRSERALVPGRRRRVSVDRLNPVETRPQNPALWAAKWSDEEAGYRKTRGPRLRPRPPAALPPRTTASSVPPALAALSTAPTRAPSRRQRVRRRGVRVGVEPVKGELQFWMHNKCLR